MSNRGLAIFTVCMAGFLGTVYYLGKDVSHTIDEMRVIVYGAKSEQETVVRLIYRGEGEKRVPEQVQEKKIDVLMRAQFFNVPQGDYIVRVMTDRCPPGPPYAYIWKLADRVEFHVDFLSHQRWMKPWIGEIKFDLDKCDADSDFKHLPTWKWGW